MISVLINWREIRMQGFPFICILLLSRLYTTSSDRSTLLAACTPPLYEAAMDSACYTGCPSDFGMPCKLVPSYACPSRSNLRPSRYKIRERGVWKTTCGRMFPGSYHSNARNKILLFTCILPSLCFSSIFWFLYVVTDWMALDEVEQVTNKYRAIVVITISGQQ